MHLQIQGVQESSLREEEPCWGHLKFLLASRLGWPLLQLISISTVSVVGFLSVPRVGFLSKEEEKGMAHQLQAKHVPKLFDI
jgi:hypothetical protein